MAEAVIDGSNTILWYSHDDGLVTAGPGQSVVKLTAAQLATLEPTTPTPQSPTKVNKVTYNANGTATKL